MRIAITGAAGHIGTLLTHELEADHELVLLDRRPVAERPSIRADITRSPSLSPWTPWSGRRWQDALRDADVVVHLAADRQPNAPWPGVLRNNIQGTWNVLHAAALHAAPRVVFASSTWAVRGEEQARAPACYGISGPKIGADIPPRPLTPYGVSKAMGEITGRMLVDEGRLRDHVSVRIGACPRNDTPSDRSEVRHRWISHADMTALLRRCVEADYTGTHVVYGISAQPESPFDLEYTRRLLDWSPVETASLALHGVAP